MTEKRYENRLNKSNIKFNTLNPVWDNETEDGLNVFEMIDVLNEQDARIKELEKDIETIAYDYEVAHGMDIRNADWFTAW